MTQAMLLASQTVSKSIKSTRAGWIWFKHTTYHLSSTYDVPSISLSPLEDKYRQIYPTPKHLSKKVLVLNILNDFFFKKKNETEAT